MQVAIVNIIIIVIVFIISSSSIIIIIYSYGFTEQLDITRLCRTDWRSNEVVDSEGMLALS